MDNQVKILLTAVDQLSGPLGSAEKKLDNFGAKAQAIGANLEKLGTRVGGIGLAGQAALSRLDLDMGSLVAGAIDTEKALYGIANTAGFAGEKAKAMVGQWSIAINQIARETNQTQERVTAAFNDMVAKGIDPKAATAMLKPIGQAATAAGADIQDMASAAQASFSKLKIPVDQVAKSLDIMAQSGKAGAFELRDMAGYFDKITASASNLGMAGQESLASLAAAAQIARRGTGDAAQAATNLDNFLGKLNAKVTYKAFEDMGADLGKLKEEAKASGDYLGYMAAAIQKLTGGDTAKVSALFSDVQAGAFIQGMLRDLDDYKKIRDEALAANGVAAQDFATAMQSASAQIDKFKISSSTSINDGEAMESILSTLTSIADWANQNPDLAKWLIYGTAGAVVGGAVLVGIGATVTAIGTLSTALADLSAFLAANPVVLTILGIGAAAAAGWAFGTWLSGQIDVAVQALTGNKFATLGTAIYDMVQWFADIPSKLADQFDAWKQAGANLIAAMKQGIADGLKGALGIGEKLNEAIAYLRNEGVKWVQVGKDIMQGLLNGIQAKYREIVDKLKGLGTDMLNSIKDVLGIKSPSRQFMLVGEMAGEGLRIGILDKVKTVTEAAKKLGGAALYAVKDTLTANWLKDTLGDEAALAKAMAEDRRKLEEEGARVANRFRSDLEIAMDEMANYDRLLQAGVITWDTYGRAVAEATEGMKTGLADAATGVDTVSNKIKKSYRDNKGRFLPADEAERASAEWARAADDINKSLTDALFRAFEGGKGFAEAFRQTLINAFKSTVLQPTIRAILAPVSGAVASAFGAPAQAADGGIGGGLSVAQSLKSLYDGVTSGFASLGNSVASAVSYGQTALGGTYGTGAFSQQSLMLAGQNAGFSTSAFASQLGTAASYLGAAATGMFIGNLISGGYSALGSNPNSAVGLGTAIGSLLGPIGGAIGGAIGGLVNRAFGMGPKKVTGEGLQGTFGAGDFTGQEWTTWKQDGGWFRSDKKGTVISPLVGAADLALSQTFDALQSSVAEYAQALGLSADRVNAYTHSINLNLKGLDEAARQAKFDELFAEMGNAMARLALGTATYTRTGESSVQTLERLAVHLAAVNAVMASLGESAFATSLNGADMANQLADLAGGLEAFTAKTAAYYQAFYTEGERFENAVDGMRDTLINIGVNAIPKTKEAFRALMEAQDLTTISGRATYAALLNVSAGFAELVNNIEGQLAALKAEQIRVAQAILGERDGLERQLDELLGRTDALRARELAAIDPLNRALYLHVQALKDAQAANAEYAAQLTALAGAGEGIAGFVRELRQGLTGAQTDGGNLASLRGTYRADLDRAQLGDVTASQAIVGSAQAYLEALRNQARSRTEYDIAATRIAADLEALPATKSYAQQQAESLAALVANSGLQISKIGDVKDSTDNVDENTLGILDETSDQINELRRLVGETITNSGRLLELNSAMLALRDALAEMTEAEKTKAAIANQQLTLEALVKQQEGMVASVNAGISNIWSLANQYGVFLNKTAGPVDLTQSAVFKVSDGLFQSQYGQISYSGNKDVAGFKNAYYAAGGAYDQTYGMADDLLALKKKIDEARAAITALGGIPQFAVGTNYVPEDMTARIHKGERVIPAADNAALMDALTSPARREAVLVEEIRRLREEVAQLRTETRATATHTAKTARLLDRVMPDGDALSVRTAT